MQKAVS